MTNFIFYLDECLQVFTFQEKTQKPNQTVNLQIKVVYTLNRQKNFLNLADKFSILWEILWEVENLQSSEQIIFLIGQKASFTDTRIVYIWLQTWLMFKKFSGKKAALFLKNIQQTENTTKIIYTVIQELKTQESLKNTDLQKVQLNYSAAFKIGDKTL